MIAWVTPATADFAKEEDKSDFHDLIEWAFSDGWSPSLWSSVQIYIGTSGTFTSSILAGMGTSSSLTSFSLTPSASSIS
jgi:hypothetical protein